MTFDESKHKRGGEGTKQGGQFVASGTSGTPTQKDEGGGTPAADPRAVAKRETKVASLMASYANFNPGGYDTPEKQAAARTRFHAALDEQAAKREWKQADKQSKAILSAAVTEKDPQRSLALHAAAVDALRVALAKTEAHTAALEKLVKAQDAYWATQKG